MRCFANFTILCFSLLLLYYHSQTLNTQHSKHALELVSGRFWGANAPPKVVILLRTSFKNPVFKQGASKTSPKPLLRSFWTARTLPHEVQERSQTHSRTLILVLLVLLEAHCSLHDTPKGLENEFCSDFNRCSIVFKLIYVSFGNIFLSWIKIEVILKLQFAVVHTSHSCVAAVVLHPNLMWANWINWCHAHGFVTTTDKENMSCWRRTEINTSWKSQFRLCGPKSTTPQPVCQSMCWD